MVAAGAGLLRRGAARQALRPRAAASLPRSSQREGQEVESGRRRAALGLPLLLRLELLTEDCRDLALHESPRHCRVSQRALLSTRTVNLKDTTPFESLFFSLFYYSFQKMYKCVSFY